MRRGGNILELRLDKERQDLRERHGIALDDMTAGEIAALVHAVQRVCSPFTDVNAELVERPVPVCRGVWFWRITAGAQIWLDEYAAKWWAKDSLRFRWAQVYALMNARDAGAFAPLTTRPRAEAAIVACALRLPVSGRELQDAIERAYGVDPADAPKPPKSWQARIEAEAQADFAAIVARLEVQSGIPRTAWLWDRSLVYAMKAYVEMHEFAAAFAAGEGQRRRMVDEMDEALSNLARTKAAIVARVENERAKAKAEADADAGKGDVEK